MTEKSAVIVKNVIGTYFMILGLACVGLLVYMAGQYPAAVNQDAVLVPSVGLVYLILVFGSLCYGLYRNRRWVVGLHFAILLIWLVLTLPFTLSFAPAAWRHGGTVLLLYYLFVCAIPISIQLFLFIKWRKHAAASPPLNRVQKIGFAAALVFSAVVVFFAGLVITLGWGMSGGI